MISFNPGHNPPHVTIPTVVFAGSKKIASLAPASSKLGTSTPGSVATA
jgi:hypothetical protein